MEFDDHLTSQARLRIIAVLAPGRMLTFMKLKEASGLADGNLHVQTRKLAQAGYVEIIKQKRGRRILTGFRITELGLESLKLHIRKLGRIVAGASGRIEATPATEKDDDSQVWS